MEENNNDIEKYAESDVNAMLYIWTKLERTRIFVNSLMKNGYSLEWKYTGDNKEEE